MSHHRSLIRKRSGSNVCWLSLVLALGSPTILSPEDAVILNLRGYAQETEQWCWAASGQAVMEFLAPDLKSQACQCRQAELRFSGLQCCAVADSCAPSHPLDPRCTDPGWPEFGKYGFDYQTTCDPLAESHWDQCVADPLPWQKLTEEIRSGRPVVFSQRPTGQRRETATGHSMVAFGYTTTIAQGQEKRWVLVFDPKRICRASCERVAPSCCHGDAWWLSYDEYRAQRGYAHWIDIYAISRKAVGRPSDRSSIQAPR